MSMVRRALDILPMKAAAPATPPESRVSMGGGDCLYSGGSRVHMHLAIKKDAYQKNGSNVRGRTQIGVRVKRKTVIEI
ncbi:hypothetical protein EVAR_31056_1 [Eumeta japonica]|uniref:Uncharacterized protein n=1 Tax=Eumeta variegata TaxID=151549 RepID=A0A4C1VD48_EUMVA|nr:hypothetical protein EVAR_31056_1 [Eumeta japonica]